MGLITDQELHPSLLEIINSGSGSVGFTGEQITLYAETEGQTVFTVPDGKFDHLKDYLIVIRNGMVLIADDYTFTSTEVTLREGVRLNTKVNLHIFKLKTTDIPKDDVVGDMSTLATTNKETLVSAVNEVVSTLGTKATTDYVDTKISEIPQPDLTSYETKTGAQEKATTAETNAKSYADTKIAELVGSAPETLNTLQEIANALGDNPNHTTEILEQIGTKAPLVHEHTDINSRIDTLDTTVTDLKQFANDSIKAITGVIGSPLTESDSYSVVVGKITDLKRNMVNKINSFDLNVTVSESDSLESLINSLDAVYDNIPPKPGLMEWMTPGTYVWTVPPKVTVVNVELQGAGGGGGGGSWYAHDYAYGGSADNGNDGEDSSFGSTKAAGGKGGTGGEGRGYNYTVGIGGSGYKNGANGIAANGRTAGTGGSGKINSEGVQGTTGAGSSGAGSLKYSPGRGGNTVEADAYDSSDQYAGSGTAGSYGAGGGSGAGFYGKQSSDSDFGSVSGGSGGSGYNVVTKINVTPGQVITIVVGKGGNGGNGSTSGKPYYGGSGGRGGNGYVKVSWG